jgi:opacity protein-like surface antigen
MKRLIFTSLALLALSGIFSERAAAQQDSTARPDTTIQKQNKFTINYRGRTKFSSKQDIARRDSIKRRSYRNGFSGGITFTRIDLGFSKLIDNGSFSLSPTNDFLDYKPGKTSTFSFDVLQYGYRFNQNFKVYLAGGFDWTLIRLKKNITIQNNTADLSYVDETINFSKNRFSSSYVHFPLNFELRTKENDRGNRFYFVFGPEIGFLLNGKIKQISDENGKEKVKDDYHFQPFRYGGSLRIGYGSLGIFTKYYASDMFDTAAQKGLKNMSFGITLGLN